MRKFLFYVLLVFLLLSACGSRRFAFRETRAVQRGAQAAGDLKALPGPLEVSVDTMPGVLPQVPEVKADEEAFAPDFTFQRVTPEDEKPGSRRTRMYKAGQSLVGLGAGTLIGTGVLSAARYGFDWGTNLFTWLMFGAIGVIVTGIVLMRRSGRKRTPTRNEPVNRPGLIGQILIFTGACMLLPALLLIVIGTMLSVFFRQPVSAVFDTLLAGDIWWSLLNFAGLAILLAGIILFISASQKGGKPGAETAP